MRVIGQGHVHIYEPSDECPHEPNNEELWQESWALFAWDPQQRIFIFLRLGQEPNRGSGFTSQWVNIWTPDGLYKHTDDSIPLSSGQRTATSLSVGEGGSRYAYDGHHNWAVSGNGVQLTLSMRDSHPGFGFWPADSWALTIEAGKEHIEAIGHVSGSVTTFGRTYDFGGTAWRDHSWGKRNWRGFRSHRYYAAIFDDDLSFFGVTMVGADGSMTRMGTILRGDTVESTLAFDIVAYLGEDGVSNCGGRVALLLDGEMQRLEFEPYAKSVVSVHQSCVISDALCKVTMGDLVGVGISESSNNAQGGTGAPAVFPHSRGVLDNGLHPSAAS